MRIGTWYGEETCCCSLVRVNVWIHLCCPSIHNSAVCNGSAYLIIFCRPRVKWPSSDQEKNWNGEWRILIYPNLITSQLLQSKYFPQTSLKSMPTKIISYQSFGLVYVKLLRYKKNYLDMLSKFNIINKTGERCLVWELGCLSLLFRAPPCVLLPKIHSLLGCQWIGWSIARWPKP